MLTVSVKFNALLHNKIGRWKTTLGKILIIKQISLLGLSSAMQQLSFNQIYQKMQRKKCKEETLSHEIFFFNKLLLVFLSEQSIITLGSPLQ